MDAKPLPVAMEEAARAIRDVLSNLLTAESQQDAATDMLTVAEQVLGKMHPAARELRGAINARDGKRTTVADFIPPTETVALTKTLRGMIVTAPGSDRLREVAAYHDQTVFLFNINPNGVGSLSTIDETPYKPEDLIVQ